MSYARPLIRVACLILGFAAHAAAQVPQPTATSAPAGPEFLPRYDFHMTIAALTGRDDPAERFFWDAHFGGSFDLLDYVAGRASVLIDYEAVLGNEFRPFDPNQANYTLEASLSARAGQTEILGVFHHVSRHLSDRPKHNAIAWNAPGVRVLRGTTVRGAAIDGHVDIARVVQHSFVDYTWITEVGARVHRPVTARAGVFARGWLRRFAVDRVVANRESQTGVMVEAGLRLTGRGGALEAFAGFEHRVDAYPLERIPQNWGLVGFRLLSR